MKKVIVTGANGFVGAAVCRELVKNGIKVFAVIHTGVDRLAEIKEKDNISIVKCDLERISELQNYIDEPDIDVFYHFAWTGSAGPMRSDLDVQINNMRYSCDAVNVAAKLGCRKFVFASSIMEYEIAALMETDTIPGKNTLYSSAKLAADYMSRTVAGCLGISYIRAVISNIYGPGERSPRLINMSIQKLMKGEHCAFSAGEQMYDFIYVDDAAKAFVSVGEKGKSNKTYYIGSLSPRKLKDYLREMRDTVDSKEKIGLGELPFDGVSLTYKEFDIEALKNDTGFEPSISFGEGIKRTMEWLRKEI